MYPQGQQGGFGQTNNGPQQGGFGGPQQGGFGGPQQGGFGGPQQGGFGGPQQGGFGGPQQGGFGGPQQGGFGGPQQGASSMPASYQNVGQKVDLSLKGINLRSKDTFSKSDPYVIVECQMKGEKFPLGKTETIKNNCDPEWSTNIHMEFIFQINQELTFTVMDHDSVKDDILGIGKCSLGSIVSSNGPYMIALSKGPDAVGHLQILYQKIASSNYNINFELACRNVKDIEVFSKSDPFVRIWRAAPEINHTMDPSKISEQSWQRVHDTECVNDNLNPNFKPFSINKGSFCQNNPNLPLRLDIWDYSSRGKHELIGKGYTSLSKIMQGMRSVPTRDAKGKPSGTVEFLSIHEDREFDILDYARIGLKLNLAVGIDFTGSNGDPNSTNSLHYIKGGEKNQYQSSIKQIGRILVAFDSDKIVPSFGFGAKVDGTYRDLFPLSLGGDPNCNSWEGVLNAYEQAIHKVALWGPTNFAPLIRQVREFVERGYHQNPMIYTILLIITDGKITDMDQTIQEILKASDLPMSLIIVGVGEDDFDSMQNLDGDAKSLGGNNKRDSVQFVKFNDCKGNGQLLAEQVLKEVPIQISHFYRKIGRTPQ